MRWLLALVVVACGGRPPTAPPPPPLCGSPSACAAPCMRAALDEAERCFATARALSVGDGGVRDDVSAQAIYRQLCDVAHAQSCLVLAIGDRARWPRAERLLQRDCDGDDATACERLADALERVEPVDHARIAALTSRALAAHLAGCAARSAQACHHLAFYYRRGASGIDEDRRHAIALFEGACDQGIADACDQAADDLRELDLRRARDLYRRTCDLGRAMGCAGLAMTYEDGDVPRAIAAWQRACDLGSTVFGCGSLGELIAKQPHPDLDRVMKAYLRACDAASSLHCFVAALIAERRGESGARKLFARACDAGEDRACKLMHHDDRCRTGDDDSCATLAKIYLEAPERRLDEQALDLLAAACGRGGAKACGMLGEELDEGQRLPRDLPRAIPLLDKGCDTAAQYCRRLWRIYTHGEVPRDPVKAKEASDRACALDATYCP